MSKKLGILFFITIAILLPFFTVFSASFKTEKRNISFGFKEMTQKEIRTIDTIVVGSVYNTSLKMQTYSGVISVYRKNKIAPHYLIDTTGRVYNIVSEKNIALQGGKTNDHAIQIDIMGKSPTSPNMAQFKSLEFLKKDIKSRYTIK